jgi:hypothetical protein
MESNSVTPSVRRGNSCFVLEGSKFEPRPGHISLLWTFRDLKNDVFWEVVPCRSYVNRCFGGTYRVHFQGRKIRERGTSMSRWLQTESPVEVTQLYKNRNGGRVGHKGNLFLPWKWRRYVPPKRRFTRDHGTTSQKTTFFIVAVVKTSNLTFTDLLVSFSSSVQWSRPRLLLLHRGYHSSFIIFMLSLLSRVDVYQELEISWESRESRC